MSNGKRNILIGVAVAVMLLATAGLLYYVFVPSRTVEDWFTPPVTAESEELSSYTSYDDLYSGGYSHWGSSDASETSIDWTAPVNPFGWTMVEEKQPLDYTHNVDVQHVTSYDYYASYSEPIMNVNEEVEAVSIYCMASEIVVNILHLTWQFVYYGVTAIIVPVCILCGTVVYRRVCARREASMREAQRLAYY